MIKKVHVFFFLFLLVNIGLVFAQHAPSDFTLLSSRIDSLMSAYNIPGVQLAIARNETIVYKKSFGWADRETRKPVTDSSLFRIASISKPITLITVLKLMEENKLIPEKLIFGYGGILSDDFKVPDNNRVKGITVQHLLDHKSGWVNEPDDPMFWRPDLTQKQLIQRVLDTRQPKYEPGIQYSYSNFGYCLLGRIIEKVTGMAYDAYVRQAVLLPSGITDMSIAGDTYEERQPNEVTYYSRETLGAYKMSVGRMDAHGGWIASATDLVKLLIHVDRNQRVKDILLENSMQSTYLSYEKWIHSGSIPGTTTLLSRQNNQWGYALLANTRTPALDEIIVAVQQIMDQFFR